MASPDETGWRRLLKRIEFICSMDLTDGWREARRDRLVWPATIDFRGMLPRRHSISPYTC
jgi:hypothetical protein